MLDSKDFIAIGKIVKTVGIKGNLKVISLTDFPERFEKLEKIFLYDERSGEFHTNKTSGDVNFQIEDCIQLKDFLKIKIKDFDDLDKSKSLVGMIIMLRESDRVKLEDGQYYFYELVGLEMFDKNVLIGKVVSLQNYGSGDLFNVKHGNKEILIPFKKEFVKNIDIENKRIDVDLIEGFLDSGYEI